MFSPSYPINFSSQIESTFNIYSNRYRNGFNGNGKLFYGITVAAENLLNFYTYNRVC
jgi:hypothetical protein